jgi:general secretion pathway protein L
LAETLFVRLSDAGATTWGAFDATGRLVGALGRGSLQSAQAALGGRRCTALVNSVDVLTAEAALPIASQARLRQIAPFTLEESLANDVDEMAFAIGSRLPSGATQVAAVAKERIDAWLAELHAAGISPTALCSEADGIPDIPATLVVLIEGERIAGRKPGRAPFVFEGLPFAQVLSLALARKADEPELRHIRVFTDAAGHAHFAAELAELGSQFASADVKLLSEGVFPHLAATLAQRPGTNLLQGVFAPKSNWLALAKPWRFAASLLAVVIGLGMLLQGAQYWQLRQSDAALEAVVGPECQRVVGDSSMSGCRREVNQRLGTNEGPATEDFLSTLTAVAAARDPQMRIDRLSYRNRAMNLQLVAPDLTAIDAFSRALEQTRRFEVTLEANSPVDDGTEGRLRIAGAAP